ncbi:MAG: hypothetical protein WBD31_08235 [Rubripirellula sp.]
MSKPKRPRLQITIRESLLIITAVGIFIAWQIERRVERQELSELRVSAFEIETRLDAIQSLEELGDDGIPNLLFSVTDPHTPVARAANSALRRVTDHTGFGDISHDDRISRLKVVRDWINWYLGRIESENLAS